MTRPTPSAMLAMAERLRDRSEDSRIPELREAADMLRDAALAHPAPLSVPVDAAQIVREEWQRVAREYGVERASPAAEFMTARILERLAAAPDIRSEDRDAPGTASTRTSALSETGPAIRTEGTKEEEA